MKLLNRFDFYVLTARFGGRIHVSELRPVCLEPTIGRAESVHRLMDKTLDQLAAITALVAGVPVETSPPTSRDSRATNGQPALRQVGLKTIG